MRRVSGFSASIFLLFLVISISSVAFFQTSDASAQQCQIEICKQAEGAGDTIFPMTLNEGGLIDTFELVDGFCDAIPFTGSTDIEVTEDAIPGWVLDDVVCLTDGIDVTIIDGGVDLDCVSGDFGTGTCTFINVRSAADVPTLSELGMISVVIGLGLIGVFFAVRRKRAFNS